jgi:hypothetical protein
MQYLSLNMFLLDTVDIDFYLKLYCTYDISLYSHLLLQIVFVLIFLPSFFFLEAFCDISHRLGGITPFVVFSDAFPGLKMWVTFACASANFLIPFIISIAVLENVRPDAGLQKNATFPQ